MDETNRLALLLRGLGEAVSRHVIKRRDPKLDYQERGFEGGDTIYHLDKLVEPVIQAVLEEWPDDLKPLVVVAEGMGNDGVFTVGSITKSARYRILIDPIDGTRGLMYDKRSAWFLASIAKDKGDLTKLSDTVASVMVEIPTSKQHLFDLFVARRGSKTERLRKSLFENFEKNLKFGPSTAVDLRNSFSQVSNFFPGTKMLAAELMEVIAEDCMDEAIAGGALIFEDQYISTGGQFVQLICGQDRFCCDLRPLFYKILEAQSGVKPVIGLECHPYDVAGLMVAENAGVIITDGWGNKLDAEYDVQSPVHWCGYSNATLQQEIQPIIQSWLRTKLK